MKRNMESKEIEDIVERKMKSMMQRSPTTAEKGHINTFIGSESNPS